MLAKLIRTPPCMRDIRIYTDELNQIYIECKFGSFRPNLKRAITYIETFEKEYPLHFLGLSDVAGAPGVEVVYFVFMFIEEEKIKILSADRFQLVWSRRTQHRVIPLWGRQELNRACKMVRIQRL